MNFMDEAIVALRAEVEQEKWASGIDLRKEQVICGEAYQFAPNQFFDNCLEIMVPQRFFHMPEEKIAEKYLTAQKPQVILTNQDYTIDITLNWLEGSLKAEQVPLCLQKLKNTICVAYPATLFFLMQNR